MFFFSDLEAAVGNGGITPNSDPIMIIGAGLTAADAIISAQVWWFTLGYKPS